MTEPILYRPCIVAPIRQSEAAGVTQHVGMHLEVKTGTLAYATASDVKGPSPCNREHGAPHRRALAIPVGR